MQRIFFTDITNVKIDDEYHFQYFWLSTGAYNSDCVMLDSELKSLHLCFFLLFFLVIIIIIFLYIFDSAPSGTATFDLYLQASQRQRQD